MNKSIYLLGTLLFLPLMAQAEVENDTLKTVEMSEVEVISSPKENGQMRQQPTAVSLLGKKQLEDNHITSIKGISALVPNFYIPDYGSRLTSAIYIRGIGSRINNPAVGMYVDNIPYVDKSAYDFNLYDIERIDVLRGPQGTLYGRNTMGGLLKVHTRNPFSYQGTDVHLSAATTDYHRSASLTHYHRVSDQFAFSAGGYYEGSDGFFKNDSTGHKADGLESGGGRIRALYLPTERLKFDMSVGYDYSDEGAYPYYYTGSLTEQEQFPDLVGKLTENHQSKYRRGLLNAGLNIEYQAPKFTLNAVTGYQNLNDRMFMDQDFMSPDIYTIEQKQKVNTLSEEVTLKTNRLGCWEGVTGAYFMYQWLHTTGPVTFYGDGLRWLESTINGAMPANPQMAVSFTGDNLEMGGTFETPMYNTALFHQSTFHITNQLSASVGLRLDYEHNQVQYNAPAIIDYGFSMPQMRVNLDNLHSEINEYQGTINNDYLKVLPKLALKYDLNDQNNIYVSVAKGMRSGGYNVQMFSDVLQSAMQAKMMSGIKEGVFAYLDQNMPSMAGRLKPTIENAMPQASQPTLEEVEQSVSYKPEFSWNYELGTHLSLIDHILQADAAIFYMHTRDQQIARFATNAGFGRMIVNAGKSQSYGAEASLRWTPDIHWTVMANYGYTHSTFLDYDGGNGLDYSDNYVPFVPQHTANLDAQYTWYVRNSSWLHNISLGANYTGAGRIYWTEANDVSQSFYSLLGARLSLQMQDIQVEFWGHNLTNSHYNTFYFESASRGYRQKCKPLQIGVDLRVHF